MEILCPKCQFSRFIPESKIPASASLATCPKCGHKFHFRPAQAPEDVVSAPTPPPPHLETPQAPPAPTPPEIGQPYADTPETTAAPEAPSPAPPLESPQPEAPHHIEAPHHMEAQEAPEVPETPQAPPRMETPQAPSSAPEADKKDVWEGLDNISEQDQPQQHAHYDEGGYEEHADYEPQDNTEVEVPWERLDHFGFYQGFLQTLKRAMFQAPLFFRYMPIDRGTFRPLGFAVLITTFQGVLTMLWQMLGFQMALPNEAGVPDDLGMMFMGGMSIGMLIAYPIIAVISVYIGSAIYHVMLMIFQSASGGFEGTFRAVAYGNAPMILGVIPFVGPIIGAIWGLVVTVIGLKNIHQSSYARVILALVAPFFVLFLLGIVAAIFIPTMVGT